MRPVTRNVVVAILLVIGGLLALGALPATLGSGDPYYVKATAVESNGPSVNGSTLSDRRYPYIRGALVAAKDGTGRSDPYQKGPFGVKGAFTHSPFDEVDALTQQYPNATEGDAVFVRVNGTRYRTTIIQDTTHDQG